jgi:hypothetical protein
VQLTVEDETERLLVVLYWLVDRAVFYHLLGSAIGATYFPSALRSNLFALTSLVLAEPAKRSAITLLVDQVNRSLDTSLHRLTRPQEEKAFVSLDYPPLFQYLCNKVGRAGDLVASALSLRMTDGAVALRQALCRIEDARRRGDNRQLHSLTREFTDLSAQLGPWLTATPAEIRPGKLLRILGVNLQLFDDFLVSLPIPSVLRRPFFPGRPHLAFLRDLTTDLLEVYALGESYERLFRSSE